MQASLSSNASWVLTLLSFRIQIRINFEAKSVSIPLLVLDQSHGDSYLFIPTAISRPERFDDVNGLSHYSERWLHSHLTLSQHSIAYVVEIKDVTNSHLQTLVTAQNNVVIRINSSNVRQWHTTNSLRSF